MQGRVMQVINMRPDEILSLIEEAKGTSAYLIKKKDVMGLISKKQRKIEETERIMKDEVVP